MIFPAFCDESSGLGAAMIGDFSVFTGDTKKNPMLAEQPGAR